MSGEPWLDYQTGNPPSGSAAPAPYLAAATAAEAKLGLPRGSLAGVLSGESTAPGLVSSAGAITPFQMLPSTMTEMGYGHGRPGTFTPDSQAMAAGTYLKQQLGKFGDMPDAYAAYNAGPGGAQKWIAAGRPADGFGGVGSYVSRASTAQGGTGGTQVAQADTGTQSDAPWLDYQTQSNANATAGQDQQPLSLEDLFARNQDQETYLSPLSDKGKRGLLPPQPTSFLDDLNSMATGMTNQLLGGMQKTSPIAGRPIGTFRGITDDSGQAYFTSADGKSMLFDPSQYVMLKGTDGKSTLVYRRTPETDESAAPAIGRILGMGAMSSAPEVAGAGGVKLAIPPTVAQKNLAAFDAAGVTPRSISAVGGNAATKMIHNFGRDFVVTAPTVRNADTAMLNEAGQSADRLASTLGPGESNAEGGASLIRGAESFKGAHNEAQTLSDSETILAPTRQTSFAQKAGVLYNRLDGLVPSNTEVTLANTGQALKNIVGKYQNPDLAKELTNPILAKWEKIVSGSGGKLTWSDARAFRSDIGSLLNKPELVSNVPTAELKQLYGSLTQDLEGAAQTSGGSQALFAMKRADQYYGAGIARIKTALGGILKEGQSDEGAFSILNKAATEGAGLENAAKLTAIRRSMPDEEWNNVSATILRKLGEPLANEKDTIAEQAGFSAASFLTRYEKLSDTAKQLLFSGAGRGDLQTSLDSLLTVVSKLKSVQRMGNTSRTGMALSTGGYGAWLFHAPVTAASAGAGAWITAKAITNPTVIRLITNGIKAQTPQQLIPVVTQLKALGFNAPLSLPSFQESIAGLLPSFAKAPAAQNDGHNQ